MKALPALSRHLPLSSSRNPLQFAAALALVIAVAPVFSAAQTFSTLLSFDQTEAANPYATLIQGKDGNFYGTSQFGSTIGYGNVFQVTPDGTATSLYSFCSQPGCTDGYEPTAGLAQASNGNLYGTTPGDVGTVFSLTPEGTLTTLHTFCSQRGCTDGTNPNGSMIEGSDGNFYGTTTYGGAYTGPCKTEYGSCGTVFKVTPEGVFTTIHSFVGRDGAYPYAGLIQGLDGNFYGTTQAGGLYNVGTVFRMSLQGTVTLLHSFDTSDGAVPTGTLVQAIDGDFYGTTSNGGLHSAGVIFKITSAGVFTQLYSFDTPGPSYPNAGLVQASDGNFYGTTYEGGSCRGRCGTLYKFTPGGGLVTLHDFCTQSGCPDGEGPYAGLVRATDGDLYGVTVDGGHYCYTDGSCGTMFKLSFGSRK